MGVPSRDADLCVQLGDTRQWHLSEPRFSPSVKKEGLGICDTLLLWVGRREESGRVGDLG